jgi:hypothetical protein
MDSIGPTRKGEKIVHKANVRKNYKPKNKKCECYVLKFLRPYPKGGFPWFASLIYRGMRYIKLFESFNNYELPNFRVELVKPGMSSGKWLFTCVDGSWNSFFGVFDLDGLKKLEDAMNTECVFAELSNAIKYGGKNKENLAFEAHTTIIVSEIDSQDKYINLQYRDLDIPFFSQNPVSNVSNPPPGLVVGEDGLQDEHIVHGYSVTTSKSPLKESPDEEEIRNYPIVVNELNYVDHHWSDHQRTMDYEKAFDETGGFRKRPIEEVDYVMKDIEPYMASIIDAGVPKGVLKTIEKIKNGVVPIYPKKIKDPVEKDFEESSGFYEICSEIENIKWSYLGNPQIYGKDGYKERFNQDILPLVQKAKKILAKWSSKLPREYVENNNIYLEYLFMK